MEQHTSLNCLYKPVALSATSLGNSLAHHNINNTIENSSSSSGGHANYSSASLLSDFVALAGSDISQSSQVYLLYEMPTDLLGRRFLANETRHSEKLKLLVK